MRIDFDKICYQFRMDKTTLFKVLSIFVTSTNEDCSALRVALQSKELSEVKRLTHKLKSSYAYIMLDESVELCNMVKFEAERTKSVDSLEPIILKIFEIHQELLSEINSTK